MKTKALRLYGENDLRLEEFELPKITDDEILAEIVTDSICMSSYKAAIQGSNHKRVPDDINEHPAILGHEFCGDIVEVGANWQHKYKVGDKFVIQPAHYHKGSQMAPGYSYEFCGGDAQYGNVPIETLLENCLLPYNSDTYYYGSLAEPLSCVIGTFHAMYHTKAGSYVHEMGIKEGGKMAMLASVGPMGLAAIDYAIHCDRKPSLLVVTDIDEARLERAASIYTVEEAEDALDVKVTADAVDVNIRYCPAVKHFKKREFVPHPCFEMATSVVYEVIASESGLGFEMISYEHDTGAAKFRFFQK